MKTASARIEGVDASYKDLVEISNLLRYRDVKEAKDILERVIKGEMYVPYRRYNKKMGHRERGIKGRFPKKEARILLKLLNSCVSNAKQRGMDENNLKIIHISANKKAMYYRIQPKGKPFRQRLVLARAEIILGERDVKGAEN
ncbi:MAG: 50S ribosomal protein L22 [Candidatus Micrarchaeota archaeon]|nr:50S ribosomal protein L22 [Candidatus Micrarchaeota archaeon]MCX8154667.1 50S ribosomal protein L22 [Candidatus Micrarchaeota archaeon]